MELFERVKRFDRTLPNIGELMSGSKQRFGTTTFWVKSRHGQVRMVLGVLSNILESIFL